MEQNKEKTTTRYYELDLLRFFAAMAVVFFHYLFRGQKGDFMPISFKPLEGVAQYGFMGINLFFMISGFVILLSARNRDATGFAISRIIRLYPAFWVAVTLTALVIFFFGGDLLSVSLPQYLANLTMLGGFVGIPDVDGVYWTLYVELQFYALIFLLLLFNKLDKIETIFCIWLIIQVLALFVKLPWVAEFFLFPDWAPFFISGASYYLLKEKGVSSLRLVNLSVAIALSLYMGAKGIDELNKVYQADASPLVGVWLIAFFQLFFILMVFGKLSWLRTHWAIKIGALTYPLYLIHQNIGYILFNHLYAYLNKYLLLFLVVILMLFLSWLINKRIEGKFAPTLKMALSHHLRKN